MRAMRNLGRSLARTRTPLTSTFQCKSGTRWVEGLGCIPCSGQACTQCRAGTHSVGGVICDQCSAGTYSAAGASACTLCSAGTYSAAGASECTRCSAGTYSAAGASECTRSSCNCEFRRSGCAISVAAPAGTACRCHYELGICSGTLVPCVDPQSPSCRQPDQSRASCDQGGGNCGGYSPPVLM
jgi:hypothetical protein